MTVKGLESCSVKPWVVVALELEIGLSALIRISGHSGVVYYQMERENEKDVDQQKLSH